MTDETRTPDEENAALDASADVDEPVADDSDAAAYLEALEAANDELQEKLAAALRERDEFQEEADKHRPTRDATKFLMSNREDVIARFGEQKIRDLAQSERVKQNRERSKNGHFPLPALEGDELERAVEATVADLLGDADRAAPPNTGPLNRCLKMIDAGGNLRQIPYEPQINNMAGSLADGYERYRLKGFKLPKPLLCATMDCSKEAAVNEAGEFAFRGYCSTDHERRTERDQETTSIPGVTNRNVLTGV